MSKQLVLKLEYHMFKTGIVWKNNLNISLLNSKFHDYFSDQTEEGTEADAVSTTITVASSEDPPRNNSCIYDKITSRAKNTKFTDTWAYGSVLYAKVLVIMGLLFSLMQENAPEIKSIAYMYHIILLAVGLMLQIYFFLVSAFSWLKNQRNVPKTSPKHDENLLLKISQVGKYEIMVLIYGK